MKKNYYLLIILLNFLFLNPIYGKTIIEDTFKDKDSLKISNVKNTCFYIAIEPDNGEGTIKNNGCKRIKLLVSTKIYNFLKEKGVDIKIAEEPYYVDDLIRKAKGEKCEYIITPTTKSWSDIYFSRCVPQESNISFNDDSTVIISIYQTSTAKLVGNYLLYSGEKSNWIKPYNPEKYLELSLKYWWKTQK